MNNGTVPGGSGCAGRRGRKFIYVFDDESREALLRGGFELLRHDAEGGVAVFLNEDRPIPRPDGGGPARYILSDMFTL